MQKGGGIILENFANIIGYENEKKQLMQICDVIKNFERYAKLGVKKIRGLLLHGPMGVGKTLMATSLMQAIGHQSYIVRKDKIKEEFITYIEDIFETAKENTPSIILFDDMDKFFSEDNQRRNPEELIMIQSYMDQFKDKDIFIIATANVLRDIPTTLLRAGRFEKIIKINRPNRKDAIQLIENYIQNKPIAKDITPQWIGNIMNGSSCAELEGILNEAGIYAVFHHEDQISRDSFLKAFLMKKFNVKINDFNWESYLHKQKVAYHEAGHIAIAYIFNPKNIVFVSIFPNQNETRGITKILEDEDYNFSYQKMYEDALYTLAGKAAVEMKFNEIDVGATSDLEQTSFLTQRFIKNYVVHGFDYLESEYIDSRENVDKIVKEANKMIGEMYDEVKSILFQHWDKVEKVANELLKRNILVYDDIVSLLQ